MQLFTREQIYFPEDGDPSNDDFTRFSISRSEDAFQIKSIKFTHMGVTYPKNFASAYQRRLTRYSKMTKPDGTINPALRICTVSPYTVLVYIESVRTLILASSISPTWPPILHHKGLN